MKFSPKIDEAIKNLRFAVAGLLEKKAEIKERLRQEHQCTGKTISGERCRAWSVVGDTDNRCIRHGGAETAAIPKSERFPACRCSAYQFPHRHRSGLCMYPDEPMRRHLAPQGQRKYYKRQRKAQRKRWLKELGL